MQTSRNRRHLVWAVVSVGIVVGIIMAVATFFASGSDDSGGYAVSPIINGAGASFPFPLYSKWVHEYENVQLGARIDYSPIGSGGGIRQIIAGTVDYAGSDAPMTDAELAATDAEILHIPTVIGSVAISYNLDVDGRLRLTPDVLASIFLGSITQWDDPRIGEINPGLKLPSDPIVVARRSDSSGTTYMFTDYLAAVSPEWAERIGVTKQPEWPSPNNLGGKGNSGVAGLIQQVPGTIGYIEFAYALENGLPTALLQNKAGNYVEVSVEATTAAAATAVDQIPEDYRVSLVNAAGEDAYPIAGFTYLLVHREQESYEVGKTLVSFSHWALHGGQSYASDLLYAPLPKGLVNRLDETLREITYDGEPILTHPGQEGGG